MLKMGEDEAALTFNTLARGEHCIHIKRKDWRKGHLGSLDVEGNAFEVWVLVAVHFKVKIL
jgi:hypothetical protein